MNRYAFIMKVKEGQEEEYILRHQQVWLSVKQACKKAGIQNYSIFMKGTLLFAYLECENYETAASVLTEDPKAVEWENFMNPIMDIVRADQYGGDTGLLTEVFHLD